MRWLLWKLGLVTLAWAIDHTGARILRVVRSRDGKKFVYGIARRTTGILSPDGRIFNGRYLMHWKRYNGRAKGADRERWFKVELPGEFPAQDLPEPDALDTDIAYEAGQWR